MQGRSTTIFLIFILLNKGFSALLYLDESKEENIDVSENNIIKITESIDLVCPPEAKSESTSFASSSCLLSSLSMNEPVSTRSLSSETLEEIATPDIRKENVYLLSYPRSGNTWTRYCIEYITKRPTGWKDFLFPIQQDNTWINCPLNNNFPMEVDYNAPPVIKVHEITEITQGSDYLVLILRNYKEAIARHIGNDFRQMLNMLKDPDNMYIKALQIYHEWPETRKMLIYYEDLMMFPEQTLLSLSNFFQTEHNYVPTFMHNFNEHKKNVIKLYERDAGESVTRGEYIKFHSLKLTHQQCIELDSICEKTNPLLYQHYLLRYKTIDIL